MTKKIILKKADAIAFFDGISGIAKSLGINSQAISQWGDIVPETSAWPLYYLSKGEIKADISFPDNDKDAA